MNFGEILRNAREAKKLSTQDVSDAIHLSHAQVLALESHQFSALPEPMITRGFIRNYAKLLDVEHEPLIENYREMVPNEVADSLVVNASVNQVYSENKQRPWLVYILGSILILLALLVWLNYLDYAPAENADLEPEAVMSETEVTDPSQAGGYVPPAEVPKSIEKTLAKTSEIEREQPRVTAPVADNSGIGEKVDQVNPADSLKQDSSNEFDINASDALSILFTDESWLSVRDGNGKVIFEKLMTTGTRKEMHISKPFRLTIGNANTVSATYAGNMINLAAVTRSNVARVKME